MNKWTGGGIVPDCRVLLGSVLNSQVAEVEEQVKEKIKGKVGIVQCDHWKNNAKKSVVSTMLMVENEVCTFASLALHYLHYEIANYSFDVGLPYEHA